MIIFFKMILYISSNKSEAELKNADAYTKKCVIEIEKKELCIKNVPSKEEEGKRKRKEEEGRGRNSKL